MRPKPFLRVPPFPGARVTRFARRSVEQCQLADEQVDRLLEEVRHLRVGGDYWARQPILPVSSYILIKTANTSQGEAMARLIARDKPVLHWTPHGGKIHASGGSTSRAGGACDPWHLLTGADHVVVDANDELALIAAVAGISPVCVGEGAFSVLGKERAGRTAALRELFRHAIGAHAYLDPFTGEPLAVGDVIRLCGFWRELIDSNRNIASAVGFGSWKRPTVAPLLWGGSGEVPFASTVVERDQKRAVAIWRARAPRKVLKELGERNIRLIEVEDGFIRSAGLGADCVPPLSIVVDPSGIYFDPRRPSLLEQLIQSGSFPPELLQRARQLRQVIVDSGVSKYGAGADGQLRRRAERRHILVPGQVEDDRAVICGGGEVKGNLDLLRRARRSAPDAYIIYKPHPDVEAGHRIGAIPDSKCLTLADEIVRDQPIPGLIDLVDEVHVNTSLAGFEALLRSKPVTTYGVPFYAGWGLTHDLGNVPARRTAKPSLDELVSAALLLYPRYLDPVTGLPCPPEILVRRIAETNGSHGGVVVQLRRLHGRWKKKFAMLAKGAR